MIWKTAKRGGRHAVTLLEVIFSIGVILIGLLGLISVLPLAGRRAQDSVSLSAGSALSEQVIDVLQAQKFLKAQRLRPIPLTATTPVANLSTTSATSFCIDPMFASLTTLPTSVSPNSYSQSSFPYYKPQHNPFLDPSTAPAASFVHPRLTRVGISEPRLSNRFISVSAALGLSESQDDLLFTRPSDATLPATFEDSQVYVVSGGLSYGARIPTGEYSWLATVDVLPGRRYASLSVVVFRNRIRNFTLSQATTPPSSPEGNAIGERLAYVEFKSGFTGGAGGVVHLLANENTVSDISSDDWVMLSRNTPTGSVFRWFRVVASDGGDPEVINASDALCPLPTGTPGSERVWRRKVLLDGPDWAFGFSGTNGVADATFNDNTVATLVDDVVSVTERVVLLSDL